MQLLFCAKTIVKVARLLETTTYVVNLIGDSILTRTKQKPVKAQPIQEPAPPGINTNWFRDRLAALDTTQRKLAQHLGLDPSAVSLMLRGARQMTIEEAAGTAEFLGEPVLTVLRHAGLPDMTTNPVDRVRVVGFIDDLDAIAPAPSAAYVARPSDVPKTSEAVRYRTAMTAKDPYDGWTLFYDPVEGVSPDAVGRLCVVRSAGSAAPALRFVRRRYGQDLYAVSRLDARDHEELRLLSAAPILCIKP